MIIRRYLIREIINALFAVTTILVVAFLSQQIVRYLNFIAIGKIPTGILLQLIGFEIPSLFALLLPLGLYLGVLLAYGRLYSDSEMSIMHMSGFGYRRIFRLTAFIAFFVSLFVLTLTLFVNPWISEKRLALTSGDEITVRLVQSLVPGRFQASPDGRHVMYVEKLSRDHNRAENVFLAQQKRSEDENKQSDWMLVLASQGYQIKDKASSDQLFVTTDGYRYEGAPGQNDYKIIKFKKYFLRIPQTDAHVNNKGDDVLSVNQLWQNYDDPNRAGELQWRISIGISTFLLALLAIPLSVVRPRHGRYIALLPAILIYIVYINLLFIARRWVEQGIVPISIGMWWVHILVFIVVMVAVIGSNQFRRV